MYRIFISKNIRFNDNPTSTFIVYNIINDKTSSKVDRKALKLNPIFITKKSDRMNRSRKK